MRGVRYSIPWLALLLWVGLGIAPSRAAEEPTPEQIEFFEKRIRPLFIEHCGECHGEGRAKGGLRLTSGDALRRGGDSGAAIVPGKPDESLLLEAVGQQGDIKMPPKEKLADSEIADLRRWIEIGAPWPADRPDTKPAAAQFTITPEQRAFWSFRPVRDVTVPTVNDQSWAVGAIDCFILARLEAEGLRPSPRADRRTLIRRVTFDLVGLPPTPDAVDAFLSDERPDAWEQLVDRLLASPHYGERWGRHWLDVARYGEDQAHTFQARLYPNGYRYRDWVVQALNDDLPYDRFVTEQIAGDLLDGPPEKKHAGEIAVGYFALGPVYYADAGCAFKASLDELDDRLDTLARGFLGLTLACARCHDHKFDPISQQDYYALAGVFRSTAYREAPLVPAEVVEKYDQSQKEMKDQEQSIKKFLEGQSARLADEAARRASRYLIAAWRLAHPVAGETLKRDEIARQEDVLEPVLERWQKLLAAENRGKLRQLAAWCEFGDQAANLPVAPDGKSVPSAVVEAALSFEIAVTSALAERDAQEQRYTAALAAASEAEKPKVPKPELETTQAELLAAVTGPKGLCTIPPDKVEGLLDGAPKADLANLKQQLESLKKSAPAKYAFAHSLSDGQAANMKIHIRGNPNRTGDEVRRHFLAILAGDEPPAFSQGSGRLELARAIACAENPLTARVIVNRVWQQHFGRGIVATPSNFGALGELPTHPELLDYLARRLVDLGWSLKALHREILLSATYRQASADIPADSAIDPDNRLLWRMNRRRLDVESWRDALLAATGTLDPALGGPSANLAAADFRRRTLYGTISRHNLDALLRLFDFPDPNITSERRTITTVPLQQLFVLNSPFMIEKARALAARVRSTSGDDSSRIRQAYRLVFCREPTAAELQLGLEFVSDPPASEEALASGAGETGPAAGSGAGTAPATPKSELTRWEHYAQVLLGSNEFTFID